jgi:hypothetical protein
MNIISVTVMLVSGFSSLQAASLIMGVIFILGGMACAYVCFLCIKGKVGPNGAVGVRLNFSRNRRLYNQDKYWYDINRYGGKLTLPITIAWSLFSLVALILPVGPDVRIDIIIAIILLVTAALIVSGWRIYRYADKLVSQDESYIPRT